MAEPPTSYCPNCLAEYRPGFDTCADCGVKLVRGEIPPPPTDDAPHDPRRHRLVGDRDDVPVVLCRIPHIEAQVLATKLQREGLVVTVEEPPMSSAYGFAMSGTTGLRIWVLRSQLEEARTIASSSLSGDDAI